MALCDLCKVVPFEDLPSLPPSYETMNKLGLLVFRVTQESLEEFPGYPHQTSFDALKASASTCLLCSWLSELVHKLTAKYEEAREDRLFDYYDRYGPPAGHGLLLTKRTDGGDGFLAFTETQVKRRFYLVAGFGFCVDDEDPLAFSIIGRPLEGDAGSPKTMKRAANWANGCVSAHDRCRTEDTLMPLRVLDVDNKSSPSRIRLCEFEGLRGRYTALSHCWGSEGHYTTTRSSISARKEGIRFDELPKTFQDAVVITRALNVRYLWIDSICICEVDDEDWERESAKMAAVYSNSYLTIAASHAKDNSVGCFNFRAPRKYIRIPFTSKSGIDGQVLAFLLPLEKAAHSNFYLDLETEALTGRAWALQERILAHRTLHYAADQIYFECNEGFLGEDGIRIKGRLNNIYDSFRDRDGISEGISAWSSILWSYGPRKLTKSSDKLPAISGLARIFEERLQDHYIVGFWRKTLIEGLVWQAVGGGPTCKVAAEYRAPSWSWASIDGVIGMGLKRGWEPLATIVDYHVELKGQNPYGEVNSGWIKLRAPIVPFFPSGEPDHDHETVPHNRSMRLRTEHGHPYGSYSLLDVVDLTDEAQAASVRSLSLFVLVIVQYDWDKGNQGFQGLIITPVDEKRERFKRIGVLNFDESVLGDLKAVKETTEWPTVNLV